LTSWARLHRKQRVQRVTARGEGEQQPPVQPLPQLGEDLQQATGTLGLRAPNQLLRLIHPKQQGLLVRLKSDRVRHRRRFGLPRQAQGDRQLSANVAKRSEDSHGVACGRRPAREPRPQDRGLAAARGASEQQKATIAQFLPQRVRQRLAPEVEGCIAGLECG
jgi:hypothetical protein